MSSTNRGYSKHKNTQEIFITINEFNNYEISNFGRVRNKETGCILKPSIRKGYERVGLYSEGERTYFSIHRLVGEYFLGNPNDKPQINHKDGNKKNNFYGNLEWCTNSENQLHAYENGLQNRTINHKQQLKELHKISKKNRKLSDKEVREIRDKYVPYKYSYAKLGDEYGVSGKTIELIVKNKRYKDVE